MSHHRKILGLSDRRRLADGNWDRSLPHRLAYRSHPSSPATSWGLAAPTLGLSRALFRDATPSRQISKATRMGPSIKIKNALFSPRRERFRTLSATKLWIRRQNKMPA